MVKGIDRDETRLRDVLKKLKTSCGCGGKISDNDIEIQGDQVAKLLEVLVKLGYKNAKKGGG